MKEFLKNNAGAIIVIVAIAVVVWYFFLRKKKAESSYRITRPTGTGPYNPIQTGGTAYVIGQQGTGRNSRKCYCGKDDSTPPHDVWNFACCGKATT